MTVHEQLMELLRAYQKSRNPADLKAVADAAGGVFSAATDVLQNLTAILPEGYARNGIADALRDIADADVLAHLADLTDH